jgi:hypothetical protein
VIATSCSVKTADGMIENVYLIKAFNKSQKAETYTLTLVADKAIRMSEPVDHRDGGW